MPGFESDLDALRDDLRQVYDGAPWHDGPIVDALAPVDAKAAARRSIPNCHTIWEIVLHMASWTREVASRVRGADAKDVAEDWPAQPTKPTEQAWRAAKDDLRAAHEELLRALDALQPTDLLRMVPDQRAGEKRRTVGSHIRGILQHHTYHQGQIALLRKALNSH